MDYLHPGLVRRVQGATIQVNKVQRFRLLPLVLKYVGMASAGRRMVCWLDEEVSSYVTSEGASSPKGV